jgi:S-formylglutathione hydrolase FrmB
MNMSLTSGLIPTALQLLAVTAVIIAIGRHRSGKWLLRWIPAAVMTGVGLAAAIRLFVKDQGWSADAVSFGTVFWDVMVGFAAAVLVFGWRGSAWWRRLVSVLAVPLAVACAFAALNTATGYLPTVKAAWQRLTEAQPEQWIDQDELAAMVKSGEQPSRGTVVSVTIPGAASGFAHRTELVYLPPAWFASTPPPRLPAVMMIGAEFSHPNDWLESGDALRTLDRFAALHYGNTPVVVFPDTTGKFDNDTECVNGPRGNAADHLTKDVVPYLISQFNVSPNATNWGLVGWSSGGTCALTTAVRNPDKFSAFVALDGQLGPNAGTKPQTVGRLFGGDANAWAAFDPRSVITAHSRYDRMAAWLGISGDTPAVHRAGTSTPSDPAADWDAYKDEHAANANKLCALLSGYNIECSVVGYGGQHDFHSAGAGFANALPWLAYRLGTPDVRAKSLPGS